MSAFIIRLSVSLLLLLRSIILSLHLHNNLRQCLCLPAWSTCCQLMKTQCRLSRFSPASLASAAPGVRLLPLNLTSASHRPDLSQFSATRRRWSPVCPWPSAATSHASLLCSLLLISKLKTSHCLTLPTLSHAFSEASQSETLKLRQLYYNNHYYCFKS